MTLYRFDQIAENIRVPVMPKPEDSERYIGLEHMDSGSLRIRRWGAQTDLIGQKLTMKEGDVLFARRNAYLRRVAIAPFDGVFSAHGMVLRAKTDVCLHEFLPVFMESDYFMERAIKISVGSLSPTINWSSLNREEFELPPVDEQRRIADLLWTADDMIIRDKELIVSLIVYKKSLFENLIEKELDNGAKYVKFGELMLRSPDSGHSPISVDRETGHYVLILSAVSVNGYQRGHLKPVELTPEIEATKLQKGDFLISRSNTVELVGLVGIYDEDRNDISFPDTMMRLILDDSKIDRYFLEQYLLSRKARRKIQSFAAGTSGSMKKINRSHISALEIPLLPLEKQHSIMKMIQKCADGISAAEDRRNKNQELKKQLLNKTLSA